MRVVGIVLAAGLSRRMGQHKMLMILDGQRVVNQTCDHLGAHCHELVVVLGHGAEAVRTSVMQAAESRKVRFVVNEGFEEGMLSSFLVGAVEAMATEADYIIMQPGDMPKIRAQTYDHLLKVAQQILGDDCAYVTPSYQGRGGHPIVINRPAVQRVLKAQEDNLRDRLKHCTRHFVVVDDPGVLMDLDTPNDIKQFERLEGDPFNL